MHASPAPAGSTRGSTAAPLLQPVLPSHQGLLPMLPGAYILFVLLFGEDTAEDLPAPLSSHGAWVAAGMVAMALCFILWGVVRFRRSRRRRDFARQYLHEPWRWDHPWRVEVADSRLSLLSLLGTLPAPVIITVCLAPFIVMGAVGVVLADELPVKVISGGVCLFTAWFFQGALRSESANLHRWLVRLRYGRMHLRLPSVPLALGTRPQVELVVRRDLPHLSRVTVTLRRVRGRLESRGTGKRRRTVTLRDVEYERTQHLGLDALGPGSGFRFGLKLPPPGPNTSTVMGDQAWRHWEVQLTAKVPGADLDTTFVVPVYDIAREAFLAD